VPCGQAPCTGQGGEQSFTAASRASQDHKARQPLTKQRQVNTYSAQLESEALGLVMAIECSGWRQNQDQCKQRMAVRCEHQRPENVKV
jgi:hypothetical protein